MPLRSSPAPNESFGHRLHRRRVADLAAHGFWHRHGQRYEKATVKMDCRLFQMTKRRVKGVRFANSLVTERFTSEVRIPDQARALALAFGLLLGLID